MTEPTSENIQVSVIVACRNEGEYIRDFLDSLSRQVLRGLKVEVVFADGMSDDGTREILERYRQTMPAVRTIDNPGKIVSTGLNAAIRGARGEIILRMDAHTEYAADYIYRCVQVLDETGADNVGGAARTHASGYCAQAIALAYASKFACGGARFHDSQYEGYVDTLPYGCWRKSTFERLGLFDERLIRNQDDEFNLRIATSGGKIWQSAKIISWYRPRAELAALFRQYFQYGFWKVSVIRKHRRPASWRHLMPGAAVLLGLLLSAGLAGAAIIGSARFEFALFEIFAGLAGIYAVTSLDAAYHASRPSGWRFLPFLPIVFAAYHLSYGLGFLLGLIYRPANGDRSSPLRRVVTALSR